MTTPATRAFAAEIDAALDRLDVAALEREYWAQDEFLFIPRFLVLFGLVQDSSSRLQCRLHTRQPGRAPVDLAVATELGSMVIFNGDKVDHGVSSSQAAERRVVYTMEYVTSHEMGRLHRLFSNFKDTFTYFGIRALLRGRARARVPSRA